jgi:predicted Rossmann fold nucleotide-binding protein DprA/Smf involved in DNA uptake
MDEKIRSISIEDKNYPKLLKKLRTPRRFFII